MDIREVYLILFESGEVFIKIGGPGTTLLPEPLSVRFGEREILPEDQL